MNATRSLFFFLQAAKTPMKKEKRQLRLSLSIVLFALFGGAQPGQAKGKHTRRGSSFEWQHSFLGMGFSRPSVTSLRPFRLIVMMCEGIGISFAFLLLL
jgi:hypothetical protein